ncbi:MAG TPA: amidohydrolase family protein [Pyrinomonadaceae bacterium]|nr:amidohydrolase family protein [Pyrinomonadaceae bacterium]
MRNRHLLSTCALLILYTLITNLAPAVVRAQRNAIEAYAITNARIVPISGPTIERGTVVIRNGLIAAVGAGVAAPADARVIDGTGLTVYPGLIDAGTTLGIPQPTPATTAGERRGVGGGATPSATPTLAAAAFTPNVTLPPGLQPETLAVDLIQPGGAQIESARNAGITSALVAPREGIFIGQSAFINLAGETSQQMIVRSPVALHVGFTPFRGGQYPASLMGVFSALRQMLLDATRLREANQIYARSPRGLRRPEQDKSLLALQPVLARELPVVMHVNTEREIRRALDLAEEFNLRVIISGGGESWKVTERLRDVPVLLSLNFPKRTTAQVAEADPDPLRVLRERVDAPKTAGRLAAARVRFAFQSGAMTSISDYLSNAAKAIENGLAREEALRALTINAAEILGLADRLGTIEVGKIANLTVTRGELFDRSARIAHVFIDGQPVELKPAATPAASGAGGIATGTWTLNVNLGAGDQPITLVLQQEGETLRGSIQGALGSAQIANASVQASGELRFTVPVTVSGQTTEATFTGTITGNQMRGTAQTVGGTPGTFTGTRPGSTTAPVATPPTGTQPGTPPATTPPTSVVNLSGTWTLALMLGQRSVPGTLTLNQQGSSLSGTLQSAFGTTELSGGSIGADGFRFTTSADVQGRTIEMTITGIASGNELSGTVTSAIGTTTFKGTRP